MGSHGFCFICKMLGLLLLMLNSRLATSFNFKPVSSPLSRRKTFSIRPMRLDMQSTQNDEERKANWFQRTNKFILRQTATILTSVSLATVFIMPGAASASSRSKSNAASTINQRLRPEADRSSELYVNARARRSAVGTHTSNAVFPWGQTSF